MLPAKNEKYVEEARKLLITQFRGKPVIQTFLDAYVRQLQDVEDVLWDIIESRLLDGATGAQLDTLGAMVAEIRRGRSDAEFRVGIRIKIAVLRSKGRAVDIIKVAGLANAPEIPVYEDHRYLNFHVETYEQIGERYLVDYLSSTRAASSYGVLVASILAWDQLLRFDDNEETVDGVETFSDAESGQGFVAAAGYGLPQDMSGIQLSGDPEEGSAPRVDWLEPTSGPEGGGTVVTIHGAFFAGATSVTFDGVEATSFTVVSDATIEATTPAGTPGAVDVVVTTPTGVDTRPNAFAYVASFDPAAIAWTGWWRASYSGTPWAGTPSAGPSGTGRPLNPVSGDHTPSPGDETVNGFIAASWAEGGLTDGGKLRTTLGDNTTNRAANNFITHQKGTIIALLLATEYQPTLFSPGANRHICGDGGGAWVGVELTTTGARGYLWDNAYRTVSAPFTLNAWHVVMMRWSGLGLGGQLEIRVDDGSWVTAVAGEIGSGGLGSPLTPGCNGNVAGAQFQKGKLLEILTLDDRIGDTNADNMLGYFASRYDLTF